MRPERGRITSYNVCYTKLLRQALYAEGIAALFAIVDRPMALAEALLCAEENLRRTARNLAAVWALGR